MRDYKVKEIHALARGLDVLHTLNAMGSASLHDLWLATGIPKSSLTRILYTLSKQGYVWQRVADNAFISSFSISFSQREWSDPNWIVEIASPFMVQLCETVKWPSVLLVPRLEYMEVVETNRPKSYFDDVVLGPIGFRANLLRSASGRAYLSYCSAEERQAILTRLRANPIPGNELAFDDVAIEQMVLQCQRQGYATRVTDFGGDYAGDRSVKDDGRESAAVPIQVGEKVAAIMNITWKQHVLKQQQALETLVPALQKTARAIARAIESRLSTNEG